LVFYFTKYITDFYHIFCSLFILEVFFELPNCKQWLQKDISRNTKCLNKRQIPTSTLRLRSVHRSSVHRSSRGICLFTFQLTWSELGFIRLTDYWIFLLIKILTIPLLASEFPPYQGGLRGICLISLKEIQIYLNHLFFQTICGGIVFLWRFFVLIFLTNNYGDILCLA